MSWQTGVEQAEFPNAVGTIFETDKKPQRFEWKQNEVSLKGPKGEEQGKWVSILRQRQTKCQQQL